MADEVKVTVLEVTTNPYRGREWHKMRVYVSPKEWSVFEHLIDRYSRPVELYRQALPEAFAKLGLEPMKAAWSQKAGCACGCSPGFVVDATTGYDMWVTVAIEGADPLVDPEKVDVANARFEAVMADPTLAPFVTGKNEA